MTRLCSIDGCTSKHFGHGLCSKHYNRWRRHGDPLIETRAPIGEPLQWLHDHVHHHSDDCLTWPFGEYIRGYGQVLFDGRPQYAHRVMCILAHGKPDNAELQALHTCGHGRDGCVNPGHLYWGTRLDNARDSLAHGTHCVGERSPASRLTEDQVLEILALQGLISQSEIAKRYGIKQQHVSQIQCGKRWKHIRSDVERVRNVHRRMLVALGEAA